MASSLYVGNKDNINFTITSNSTYLEQSLPHGHALHETFSVITGSLFLLIIILAVLGNSILITTIVAVRRLHSVTHIFLVNLAVGDLITATLTMPFDLDYMWRRYFPYGTFLCGVSQIGFFISLPSSVLNLCLLTVERFVTVEWPYRKASLFRRRNVIALLVVSWSYTLTVALFIVMNNPRSILVYKGICMVYPLPKNYHIFQLVVNFIFPMSVIIALNVRLFSIANRHGRNIGKVSVPTWTAKLLVPPRRRKSLTACFLGANIKAAKRILLLVGVFAVCWLAYIVSVAHNMSCNGCHPRELTWLANVVNYSSTAINPILYGVMSKVIRQELWNKIKRIVRRRRDRRRSSSMSIALQTRDRGPSCHCKSERVGTMV